MFCWIVVAFFAACSSVQSDNPNITEVQRGSIVNQANSSVIYNGNANLKAAQVQPASLEDRTTSSTIRDCQPSKVPLSPGLPDNTNINELLAKPTTRSEFNEWLSFGSLQLAQIEGKNDLDQYVSEGDFNGDGCTDVAVIVQGLENKTGEKDLENFSVDLTVKNLRTGATFQGGDVKNLPFPPKFEAQIKPQQKIALLVVLGGEKGWSWKYGGIGRTFLLYDSIYQTPKTKNMTDVSTVFGVIEKNKPNEDYDDLLYLFPPNAKGDCIHTELEIKRKGVEYVDATKRNLICYDGKNFFAKPLPDAKLYPE